MRRRSTSTASKIALASADLWGTTCALLFKIPVEGEIVPIAPRRQSIGAGGDA